MTIFWGLMIPFIGTTLGALCVLFIKNELKPVIQKVFTWFCSGSYGCSLCMVTFNSSYGNV